MAPTGGAMLARRDAVVDEVRQRRVDSLLDLYYAMGPTGLLWEDCPTEEVPDPQHSSTPPHLGRFGADRSPFGLEDGCRHGPFLRCANHVYCGAARMLWEE